jgi:hypothetical protein
MDFGRAPFTPLIIECRLSLVIRQNQLLIVKNVMPQQIAFTTVRSHHVTL